MGSARFYRFVVALLALLFVGDRAPRADVARRSFDAGARQPLAFEANVGQLAASTRFVARRAGATLALDTAGASLALRGAESAPLTFRVNGAQAVEPVASRELALKTHYLHGKDPAKWHRDVPSFARVTYASVIDGVDLVFHGEEGQLEYDFVVAPEVDPAKITLAIGGATSVTKTAEGDLRIATAGGEIVQQRPRVYQELGDGRVAEVASSYRLADASSIGFEIASYDRSRPLVIDPVIFTYSTYIGGMDDEGQDPLGGGASGTYRSPRARVTTDSSGNAYIVSSAPPPILAGSTRITGGQVAVQNGEIAAVPTDALVTKIAPDGSLVWRTYVGGSDYDYGRGLTLGAGDEVYVTGETASDNFPVTGDAYQGYLAGIADAFVFRLNASGSALVYSTFFQDCGECSTRRTRGNGIAVSGSVVHVAGGDTSSQSTLYRALMFAIDTALSDRVYSDTIGDGEFYSLTMNPAGRLFAVGELSSLTATFPNGYRTTKANAVRDAALVRYTQAGTIEYGTFIGTSAGHSSGLGVDIGPSGDAYIVGFTAAPNADSGCNPAGNDFPTTAGAHQTAMAGNGNGFLARFDTNLAGTDNTASLVYSTLFGGSGSDGLGEIVVDAAGRAWVSGEVTSTNIARLPRATTDADGFFAVFDPSAPTPAGQLLAAELIGGSNNDAIEAIALGPDFLQIVGTTSSASGIPIVNATQPTHGGQRDLFASRVDLRLTISPTSATRNPGQTQAFTATGGVGAYQFAITANGSGASINAGSGAYTAGAIGGNDVVTVTDAVGRSASASVTVTDPNAPPADPLTVSPPGANTFPKGSVQFVAAGGTPPYGFVLASNASGGSIGGNGYYVAGARGNVTDVVRVTDSKGQTITASVSVSAALAIQPKEASVAASGTLQFSATGGSGSGYTWSASGGSISTTGLFTAPGGLANIVVTVRDSSGAEASASVSVGGALVISPSALTTFPRGATRFNAFGGTQGGFTWALVSNPSQGTVVNGDYVAGPVGNVVDVLEVRDGNGNRATATITVGPALTVTPATSSVESGARIAFTISGGSGTGYAAVTQTNESGATFDANGVYTAGPRSGTDSVRIVDSVGNEAIATVTVTAAPGTTEPPPETGTSTSSSSSSSSGASGTPTGTSGGVTTGAIATGGTTDDEGCSSTGRTSPSGGTGALAFGVLLVLRRLRLRRRR